MLKDAVGVSKIYIACGYTDLRLGIDGLAFLIQEKFHPCSSFVEERVTGSKGSISKEMDFSFFISGLLQDSDTSGQGLSPKLNS